MALTIDDVILDEEFRATQTGTDDDTDSATLSTTVAGLITAQQGASTFASFSGFPQYATNSISSDQEVTDYFLTVAAGGVATDLYVGTEQVSLYASGNNDLIFGRIGGATGQIVLAIGVDDSDLANASVWVAQYAPFVDDGHNLVDSADQIDLSGLVTLHSDFTTTDEVPFENFASVKSGQDAFAPVASTLANAPDVQLLITGFKGSSVGTVNVSTTGLGTNAQHVDPTESIRVDIVAGLDTSGALDSTFVHDAANISYDNHVDCNSAEFSISQLNPTNTPATVSVFAFQDDDSPSISGADFDFQGTAFPTNAISDPGTPVQIDADDVIIMNAAGTDITAAFKAVTGNSIVADGMGVKITGLLKDYQVSFSTDGILFDRFVITNTLSGKGPSTFDVGAIEVTTIVGGSDSESTDLGAHLIFQDDGPNIDLVSNGTVPTITDDDSTLAVDDHKNFAGLFTTPDYGADGAGTLEYILGVKSADVDSGLDDAASGENILLNYDSVTNTVTGTTETGGDTVFVISVDSSGEVTLDQQRAIEHSDTGSFDELSSAMAADLITLTAKITDSEGATTGDSDTAKADIGGAFLFKDDGPSIDDNDPSGSAKVPDTTVDFGAAEDNTTGTGTFGASAGNDGPSSGFVTIADWADMSSVGLTATLTGGGTVLTYSDGTNDIYRLTVTDSGYDFDVLAQISSPPEPLNFGALKSGSPVETISVPTLTGSHNVVFDGLLFTGVGNNALGAGKTPTSFNPYDKDGLAGHGAASPGDDLNPDNLGFGVKNGQASQMNNNEGFFFTVPGQEQLSLSFDVHGIGNLGSIMMEYWVYDSSNNEIEYQLQNVTGLKTGDQTVTIHDLQGEEFSSAYVRFFFTNGDANAGVRIINFESQVATDAPDRDIEFQLASTDSEGDQALSNAFTVHVDNPAYTGAADVFGL